MDIDDAIADLERQAVEAERKAELLRAEAKGLRSAKRYLPNQKQPTMVLETPVRSLADTPQPKRGGRQPGAISGRWQEVLRRLYGLEFDAGEVSRVVFQVEDRIIKPAEVNRQLEGYVENGYVVRTKPGWFLVSDSAAIKYGFSNPEVLGGRFARPPEETGAGAGAQGADSHPSPAGSTPVSST